MTYDEFVTELWQKVDLCPSCWRKGQSVFNVIDETWGVAREVQFVDGIDCFYNDDAINDFILHSWVKISEKFGDA